MKKARFMFRLFRSGWAGLSVCLALSTWNLGVLAFATFPERMWWPLVINMVCWWQYGRLAQNARKWDMDDWQWAADVAEARHRERLMLLELEALKDEASQHLARVWRAMPGRARA